MKLPIKIPRGRKTPVLVTGAVLVTALVVFGIFGWNSGHSSQSAEQNQQNDTSEQAPDNPINYSPAQPTDNQDIDEQKNGGSLGEPTPKPDAINVAVARTTQVSGMLRIYTTVVGSTDGSCSIELTKGDDVIRKTAAVTLFGNYYGCAVVSIPLSQFTSGSWQLTVKVEDTNTKGSVSQTIKL